MVPATPAWIGYPVSQESRALQRERRDHRPVIPDVTETSLQDLLSGPYDRATVSVALAFATWQRLTTIEGLSDEQATEVMVRAVAGTLAA